MLEHSYRAMQNAQSKGSIQVTLDDLQKFEFTLNNKSTDTELKILNCLSERSMSPREIITKTKKNRGTITKGLKSLYSNNLIEKTGQGKNVKYSITQEGEASRFY